MNSAGGQPRQMKLAVFMHGDSNYHSAGWRHPQAYADGGLNLKRWIEFAQIMERGRLDMLFIADTIGMPMTDSPETLGQASLVDKFEPLTVLAALSPMPEHLGLVATCATTYNQPYNIARMLASIDHLSGGRCGWNLIPAAFATMRCTSICRRTSSTPIGTRWRRNSPTCASAYGTALRMMRFCATRRRAAMSTSRSFTRSITRASTIR